MMADKSPEELIAYWRGRAENAWAREDKAMNDLLALVIEVTDLKDEVTDRANVEADLRAQLADIREHAEDSLSGLDEEQAAKILGILDGSRRD